jgi:hypothetical protein
MKENERPQPAPPDFLIRIHLADGSIESFSANETEAGKIWEGIEPVRLFASPRIVLAGDYSKSVFVSSQILRLDFLQQTYRCWQFPGGYADIVELSEEDFKQHIHLDQPDRMARRENPTPVGDLLVSFIKMHMVGGKTIYLMAEFPVKLPAENQSFMQFMLSKVGFHMRLREGGIGIVNLALLAGYTIYPGVAQVPADTWMTEPFQPPQPE